MSDNVKTVDPEFVLRVLRAFDLGDNYDALWWRTDSEYAPVTFMVNCNDAFFWACADCEEITPENVEQMEKAIADCKAAESVVGVVYAPMLFCARVRGMRPQGAAYPQQRTLWPLFDACGPERAPGHGNPKAAPSSAASE